MIVYAKDFTFNTRSLSDISNDLVVASFEDGSSSGDLILGRTVNRSSITYDQPQTFDYGAVDTDVYTFDITIMRKDGDFLTKSEIKALTGWLMSPVTPKWIYFERCGDRGMVYDDVFYKGRFVRSSYIDVGVSNKVGIKFEFENISAYGYTEEKTFTIAGDTVEPIVNTGTYVGKKILPVITIRPTETGTVTIDNEDDDIPPFSIDVVSGLDVTIQNHYCTLNNGNFYDFSNLNNYNWVTLKDGINHIAVTGDCEVELKARFYEAVGV